MVFPSIYRVFHAKNFGVVRYVAFHLILTHIEGFGNVLTLFGGLKSRASQN